MRWLGVPCVLLLGCRFDLPASGSDGSPGLDAVDGMPGDGPPSMALYKRRLEVVDAQVAGGPHASFPLLVGITADWLRTTAAGGDVTNPNGFDIGFFADEAGTMRLAHEVELYNGTTGALVAWVKVPSLTATSALYVHYGDPAITTSQQDVPGVWSGGFAGVWHLGNVADSTSNNNAGTDTGTTGAGGRIGNARSFNGASGAISVGSGASIDDIFIGGGTVEAWFRAAGWGEGDRGRILDKGDVSSSETNGWHVGVDNSSTMGSLLFRHEVTGGDGIGGWNTPMNSIALNEWTHVAVVYDKGSITNDPSIYINGTQQTVSEVNPPAGSVVSDAAHPARIGNRGAGDRTFSGLLDELRLSTASRSADWIQTSFRNQSAPAAFLTVSNPL